MENRVLQMRTRFTENAGKLPAMSPLAILGRGYAVPLDENGSTVRSVTELQENDPLRLRFADGEADVRVTATHHDA